MLRRSVFLLLVLGTVGWSPGLKCARSQENPPADPSIWVRHLGAADFAQRRAAFLRLRKLGAAAIPHLEKGLVSDDLEVRRRCGELLREARKTAPEKALEAFVQLGQEPFPSGWVPFARTMGGEDLAMRRRFAEVVRADPTLPTTLEKTPGAAGDLIRDRCRKLQADPKMAPESRSGLLIGLVYAARLPARLEDDAFRHLYGMCHRPEIRTLLSGDPVLLEGLTAVLRGQRADRNTFSMRLSLARFLGLEDYLTEDVPRELNSLIDEALKHPNDLDRLAQAVYLTRQLGPWQLFQDRLEPEVRRRAEALAKAPGDLNQLLQLTNLARTLDMKATLKEVLRPTLLKTVKGQAAPNTLHQIVAAARQLDALEEIRNRLRNWLERRVQTVFEKPNLELLYHVRNEVQQLEEGPLFDPFLAQAARKILRMQMAEEAGVRGLQQAHSLAQQFGLQDVLQESMPPLLLRQAERFLTRNDLPLADLQILVHLAEQSIGGDKVLKVLRPTMVRTLRSLQDRPLTADLSSRALVLARVFEIPEGIPVAGRIAVEKGLPVYTRVQAIQYIGTQGKASDGTRLDALLTDTTSLGSMTINGMRLGTQVRDVALAALVHLHGKKLPDFGFLYPRQTGLDFPRVPFQGFGFSSDADRDRALELWRSEKKP